MRFSLMTGLILVIGGWHCCEEALITECATGGLPTSGDCKSEVLKPNRSPMRSVFLFEHQSAEALVDKPPVAHIQHVSQIQRLHYIAVVQ